MWWENIPILGVVVYRNTVSTVGQNCTSCCFLFPIFVLVLIFYLLRHKTKHSCTILVIDRLLSLFPFTNKDRFWKLQDKRYRKRLSFFSVDSTNFALAWGANQKPLSCYKFKGKPGLWYKVGMCLRTSDIVWISSPHYPGLYNDLQIFRFDLIGMLEPHEQVEADDGYIGECPANCKCPNGTTRRENRLQINQLQRSRHERFNERFVKFGCMNQKFWHSVSKHGLCFDCVAVLTQLSIEHGEVIPYFNYDDTLIDQDLLPDPWIRL